MVFFTCDGCGESVKKPSVQKHRSQCRRSFKLACMDCGKDFYGEDYNTHNKCISEGEKYAGMGPAQNKNEKKQEAWVTLVQDAIKHAVGVSPAVRQMLEYVANFDNIPRKQAKFLNFLKNSQKWTYNDNVAQQAWTLISKELDKIKGPPPQPAKKLEAEPEKPTEIAVENGNVEESEKKLSKREKKEERRKEHDKVEKKDKQKEKLEEVTNGHVDHDETKKEKKKGKKRQREEEEQVETEATTQEVTSKKKKKTAEKENGYLADIPVNTNRIEEVESEEPALKKKFRWPESAANILQSQPDKELPLKKIRKKLVAEYMAVNGGDCDVDELWAKGLKRLSKNSGFRVEKDRIRLL